MASALREELQSVRVMELHARAAAEGVGEALLEDAMDSAEPRAALIELYKSSIAFLAFQFYPYGPHTNFRRACRANPASDVMPSETTTIFASFAATPYAALEQTRSWLSTPTVDPCSSR